LTDFKCISNRTHVKSNSGSVIFIGVDLFADQSTILQSRHLNICLAIDCSGSMQGEKIERAKESAIILARSLSPNDLISIVTFEYKVKVLLAPTLASEQDKIENVISSIQVGSATSLYGGLQKANDLASKNAKSGRITRIVLMTDGIPTDKENPKDYEKLCAEIRKDGITVNPIGIGDNYNDELLLRISDSGGGEWMHVTDPHSQLPNFLREQVTMMLNTIAINPELKLEFIPGAEIIDFYTVKPILTKMELPQRKGNQYVLNLRDLVIGQEQTIVFRIKLPHQPSGTYNLLNASAIDKNVDMSITYTEDSTLYNSEPNPDPRILLFATEGTVLMRKGMDGDTIALQKAETILKAVPTDPDATIALNPATQATVMNLKNIHDATVMKPNLSEAEKKDLMHDTTIIRRKENK
jgi:Mg-chelatase subunit ChlD